MAKPQQSAMDSYLSELTELIAERQNLNRRISKVEKVVRGMIELLDTEEEQMEYLEKLHDILPPSGLTTAIEQVLRSEKRAFAPTEIRDRVREYLLAHSNPMASVHTVLKRLVKAGGVQPVTKDDKTLYRNIDWEEKWMIDLQHRATKSVPLSSLLGRKIGRKTE
jgi:hypothetical protein